MFLLDTNVVSELRKGRRANSGVVAFFASVPADAIYLSVQVAGELRRGVEVIRSRGDVEQAQRLEAWLDAVLAERGERMLAFDLDCAQVWGKLMAASPQHAIDKQIAAIALIYDLTVVTRNVADFAATGVRLLDPFV